ncbi:NUDIX domain-containing protein [Geothrix edaphica]|jgi:phosphatase NudJ|uniref:NUDIX hydrolase n=1 Tax=Geothrix edaphica TaxID=2927976 RepID=A0ABQ5PXT8_9BACT|nr:NUDIX hydrolase [Geothrix edaphica]GLH67188.1 NUDIX hydrolase [Geothrix edaphica]
MWALTVAAVIERNGRFLFVEETDGSPERVLNQPAGHVEPGEGLLDAVRREVREETGLAFTPEAVVGIYQLRARNGRDYCRICFRGSVPEGAEAVPEDPQILGCRWLSREELAAAPLRSGLVLRCVDDARAGAAHPLALVEGVRQER